MAVPFRLGARSTGLRP